jgi:hypothetical protein
MIEMLIFDEINKFRTYLSGIGNLLKLDYPIYLE